jgi:transposase
VQPNYNIYGLIVNRRSVLMFGRSEYFLHGGRGAGGGSGVTAASAVADHVCPADMVDGQLSLMVVIAETGRVTERLRVREIDDDEGRWLVRIVRRGTGSVVTWRRAQMVLLSAQGMDAAGIAKVAFTSEDRVRDVIRNFNADGFGSLYPKYKGGRPPKFALPQRREIKKVAKSRPAEHDLPFSTWSLSKLAEFLVAQGVIDDISHEGLRALLRACGRPHCSRSTPG